MCIFVQRNAKPLKESAKYIFAHTFSGWFLHTNHHEMFVVIHYHHNHFGIRNQKKSFTFFQLKKESFDIGKDINPHPLISLRGVWIGLPQQSTIYIYCLLIVVCSIIVIPVPPMPFFGFGGLFDDCFGCCGLCLDELNLLFLICFDG